jgi:hypothetical protein
MTADELNWGCLQRAIWRMASPRAKSNEETQPVDAAPLCFVEFA